MSKSLYLFLIITHLIANPFDAWVDQNKNVLNKTIKSVSFQIRLAARLDSKEEKILNGQIVVGGKNQFRYEMGPRTVISDGTIWKSYDERTDQVFIQKPDKKLEKAIFSWVKVNKLKALPVQNKPDGSCKIKLFGKDNNIWAYFNPDTNVLDSILISIRGGGGSTIFNIKIAVADSVLLAIGTEFSDLFDLR